MQNKNEKNIHILKKWAKLFSFNIADKEMRHRGIKCGAYELAKNQLLIITKHIPSHL